MAFAAGTIWENRNDASNSNGGGFDPTNANFLADLTTDTNTGNTSSPVVSSASYNFAAGDVGHWVFIQSGTNWTPGWYQIASVASNKATLTASIGAAVLYGTDSTKRNYRRPNGLNTSDGVATVGTPTGGVWSIDYSQAASAPWTYTDLAIDGTTNTDATSATTPFGKQMLGNIINVTSGTGFTVQRIQLVSIPSGVIGRFDKSLGTLSSTGGNATFGGAVGTSATIFALTLALVAGNKVFVKATGTYTLTATTTVTAAVKGDITNGSIIVEGYTSYRGELDGRPLITSSTNSVNLITLNDNDYFEFHHLRLTHTAATRGEGFRLSTSQSSPLYFCDVIWDGFSYAISDSQSIISGRETFKKCEIKNCTNSTTAINLRGGARIFLGCYIHDNTGCAYDTVSSTASNVIAINTIFDTNSYGLRMTQTGPVSWYIIGCIFYNNTNDGIELANSSSTPHSLLIVNNIFYKNGGYGIDNLDELIANEANRLLISNNAYGQNTTAPYRNLYPGLGDVSLTVTDTTGPFTDAAGGDFSLNNTAGGGAACRAAGFPGAFPGGTTIGYLDIGAVQHQDIGGSSVTVISKTINNFNFPLEA